MKIREMKKGQKVEDRWYWDWGIGIIERVLKTVVYIRFGSETVKYDAGHTQFLKEIYEEGVAEGRRQVLAEDLIRTNNQIQEVKNVCSD